MAISFMNVKRTTLVFYIACITFIAMPLLSLVLTDTSGNQLIGNTVLLSAVSVSLKSTLIMMLITILIGTPAAYAYARVVFKGKSFFNVLLDLPLVLPPPAVAGLLLLMTFGRRGWMGIVLEPFGIQIPFTLIAVVMAQLFVGLPIYIKTVSEGGFRSVDERLELTAMTLGDSRAQALLE